MSSEVALMKIGGRAVGGTQPLFVIAEIGLNHGGSFDRAVALVEAAAAAGASAVKFQTLIADELVAPGAPAPMHVDAESLRDFFAQFELSEAAHQTLADRARELGLAVIATPFSEASVDMLTRVGVDAFKIASGDITYRGLIKKCARTGKPLIISTGMSDLIEIRDAVGWARVGGAASVALLHCVSAYPVPEGSENLRAITTLADVFGTVTGLSDHSAHSQASLAVALGASIYERHLMLSAGDGSIDADVSSTPGQIAAIVKSAARIQSAMGDGVKQCNAAERGNRLASRRSLYCTRTVAAGELIQDRDVIALRPGIGLSPDCHAELIGRPAPRDMEAGMAFVASDLAPAEIEVERVA